MKNNIIAVAGVITFLSLLVVTQGNSINGDGNTVNNTVIINICSPCK